jgi:hypothetical protein
VGLEAVILIGTEGDSEDAIFAHHELAVGEFLFESLEVVGGHVVEGEDVEELILGHEGVYAIDDELLVFSFLGFGLGQ